MDQRTVDEIVKKHITSEEAWYIGTCIGQAALMTGLDTRGVRAVIVSYLHILDDVLAVEEAEKIANGK